MALNSLQLRMATCQSLEQKKVFKPKYSTPIRLFLPSIGSHKLDQNGRKRDILNFVIETLLFCVKKINMYEKTTKPNSVIPMYDNPIF